MKISKNQKLFLVSFGKPEYSSSYITFSSTNQPVFVLAENYEDATQKALEYNNHRKKQKVTTPDGSLNISEDDDNVKEVKLICKEFVY